MAKGYEKRFPADTTLEKLTFLNNKKIDGELYAYLQSISKFDPIENGKNMEAKEKIQYCCTYILKKDMPTQKQLADVIHVTEKTLRAHLKELIDQGFLQKCEDRKEIVYYLPMCEDMYFMIPLETLRYFHNTATPGVIKAYIYLGMRWQQVEYERQHGRYRENYSFTYKEIGQHLGIQAETNKKNLETVRDIITCLVNNKFIEYENYFDGITTRKRLIKFRLEVSREQGSNF